MNEEPLRWEEDSLIIMANDSSAPDVFSVRAYSLDYDPSDIRPVRKRPTDS